MKSLSIVEISRQYRVLRQTLGMHAILRDDYARKARVTEITILAASVVFCSTTFAGDELFVTLWTDPSAGRVVLGIVSVITFAASIALLLVDWKSASARHAEAVRRWEEALRLFREKRNTDRSWAATDFPDLSEAYWRANRESVEIPSGRFNALKSRHLQRAAVSECKSKFPGCPRIVLAIILKVRDTSRAIRNPEESNAPLHASENSAVPDSEQPEDDKASAG